MNGQTVYRRYPLLNGGLLILLLLLALISLRIGPVPISTGELINALMQSDSSDQALRHGMILSELRLPRLLLAILVGASLGVSGAALQGLLRNPLAEPGLLGVSSCAGLGAVICLYFGLSVLSIWLLPVMAMAGATLATLLLCWIGRHRAGNLTLILSGIALSSLAAALTSLALNLAPTPADVRDMVLWLLGSLNYRSFSDIQLCLPFVITGLALLLSCGAKLDALTLGEGEAQSLGVNLPALQRQIILGTALCVGSCVAVTGSIGFVGLVVPHLLRRWVDYHPSRLLLSSAVGGAVLLLTADIALRLLSSTQEIMLGVVTALIGAPFFLLLVLQQKREAV
ncbi:MAG: iron ABC transporter permease [Gammaproteobacteria bacterium]|nr:iron ABC transporter permease [Gammaproteobacteria bacterium]MYI89752.1 iron ABC transporter permease [Gammaproteobacteria bacterium]